ncbi:MAG: hypothetical protein ACREX8_22205, partial [Gammaproteobacteria bacterium]
MERRELRLPPPILARLVRPEHGEREIIVGVTRQLRVVIPPRATEPGGLWGRGRVSGEADHHRLRVVHGIAEHGAQEVAVAEGIGFAGFVGFRR